MTVNVVYNITKYLEDHPGGKEILIEVAGTDATEAFEEIGHSDEAREQLEPYFVGDLPSEVVQSPLSSTRTLTCLGTNRGCGDLPSKLPTSITVHCHQGEEDLAMGIPSHGKQARIGRSRRHSHRDSL